MPDKKRLKKLLADMTRRMRRHVAPSAQDEQAAAPAPAAEPPAAPLEQPPERSPKNPAAAAEQRDKRLRWAYVQKKGAPSGEKFALGKSMQVLPGWNAQALASIPRRLLNLLKRKPAAAFALYGAAALALALGLPRLVKSMNISQWLPLIFNGEEAEPRWSWAKRESGVDLVRAGAGLAEAGFAPASALKDRLPLGVLDLPGRPQKPFVGVLTPREIKDKYPRNQVSGLDAQMILRPERDLKALSRSMVVIGGKTPPSPYGPAYDGAPEPRPLRGLRALAAAAAPAPKMDPEFKATDESQDRTLPKTARGEEAAEASLAHLDDIEKELKDYAKNGQWTKLHKVDGFDPGLPESAKQMLTQSQAYAQLVVTRIASYQDSFKCQLCSVEERVNNNRATYFGELYK